MWVEFLPKLLNMSITGGIIIVLVLLARLLLRRAPKVFSYALWAAVLFRLLCPVSLSSAFSVFNIMETPISSYGSIEYIPENIVHTENSTVALPLPGISEAINNTLPQGNEQLSADPLELPVSVATYLWAFVAIALLGYSIVKLVLLKRKLVVAMPLPDSSQSNIYLADHITTPFVIGLFSPKIYLPSTLDEKERRYIIQHEQYHIRRLDHVVKILAFLALCIHWFNPLVWVAFVISGNDMEMSCDEAVMKRMGSDVRADYSQSLLSLATGHRIISGSPLAFGEGDTKGRIKNVLNYKKPIVWVSVLSVIAVLILAVCFISNPTQKLQVVEITDTSELTVMEVAWYEENSQTMGATVLQTETGYLFLYRGQADLYGYYTATAKLKGTTLQIDVKSNDAVSEEYISGTLLARIEVDHSKVENVSMNFDGGNLTLEAVTDLELVPKKAAEPLTGEALELPAAPNTTEPLTKENTSRFIQAALASLTLHEDNTVTFRLPDAIPTDPAGATKLTISMNLTYRETEGAYSVQELLDWETDWKGGQTFTASLEPERGTLSEVMLRVAFMTLEEQTADSATYAEYDADYTRLTEPFVYEQGSTAATPVVELSTSGSAATISYTLKNGESLRVACTIPDGLNLATAAAESNTLQEDNFEAGDNELPVIIISKGDEAVGTLALFAYATTEPSDLAAIDTAENTIPMAIYATVNLSNHADYGEFYRVVSHTATSSNAVTSYQWQNLNEPGFSGAAADIPFQSKDCVLAFNLEAKPYFAVFKFTEGTLTQTQLTDFARSIALS